MALSKGIIFAKKKKKKKAKLRGPWSLKVPFLKLYISVYLHTKFQVSNKL